MFLTSWLYGIRNRSKRQMRRVLQRVPAFVLRQEQRRAERHHQALIEALEPRVLLAAASLINGVFKIEDTSVLGENNALTFTTNTSNQLVVTATSGGLTAGTGVTVTNNSVTLTTAPTSIDVNLKKGADSVSFTGSKTYTATGGISIMADTITVNSGATLNAGTGALTLAATSLDGRVVISPIGFTSQTASLTLTGATLTGKDITLSATAEDGTGASQLPWFISDLFSMTGIDDLNASVQQQLGVVTSTITGFAATVLRRGSEATVNLTGTTVNASGNVEISTSATTENSVSAYAVSSALGSPLTASVGYGQVDAKAQTILSGTTVILAAGSVSVVSEATTTNEVEAKTAANLNGNSSNSIGAAVALAFSKLTSTVDVSNGVTITSSGNNVNISASGEVNNAPTAETGVYTDGTGGVTVALGFDNSTVTSTVNGTIRAAGGTGFLEFDPNTAVDLGTDQINIPNHKLSTGDELVYSKGGDDEASLLNQILGRDPASIGGLRDGETYRAKVIDANIFQVVANYLDLDASEVQANAVHRLNGFGTRELTFPNTAAIEEVLDRITIPNHGFTNGQKVTYLAPDDSLGIGGLESESEYIVDSATTDTFKLKLRPTDTVAMDLSRPPTPGLDADPTELLGFVNGLLGTHLFLFEKTTDATSAFTPSTAGVVTAAAGTLTLPNHGFQSGEIVVYHVDPTKSRTVTQDITPTDGSTATKAVTLADTAINGLEEGDRYFVRVIDANTIQLTTSEESALESGVIDLNAFPVGGSGDNHAFNETTKGIGIKATLTAENPASATSEIGGDPADVEDTGLLDPTSRISSLLNVDLVTKLRRASPLDSNLSSSGTSGSGSGSSGSKLNATASVALAQANHTVEAKVGSTAILETPANIDISGEIEQTVSTQAESIGAKASAGGAAVSAAAAVSLFTNTARATVDGGAQLDAGGDLSVSTKIEYPKPFELADLQAPGKRVASVVNGVQQAPSDANDILSPVEQTLSLADSLPAVEFNTVAVATVQTAKGASIAGGGAISLTDYQNTSEAVIKSGARINQKATMTVAPSTALQTDQQSVSVTADNQVFALNRAGASVSGAVTDPGTSQERAATFLKKGKFKMAKTKTTPNGVGGSVQVSFVDNTTTAQIQSGTTGAANDPSRTLIRIGDEGSLEVKANEEQMLISLAQAGGRTSKFGLSGTASVLVGTSNTTAQLAAGIQVTGGSVDVSATSDQRNLTVAGAVTRGSGVGIGLSIAVNQMDRTTQAIIGVSDSTTIATAGTSINATGDITVNAVSTGGAIALSLAGAQQSTEKPKNKTPGKGTTPSATASGPQATPQAPTSAAGSDTQSRGQFGLSISGGVSWNTANEKTFAIIRDNGSITATGGVSLNALADTTLIAGVGAVSLNTQRSGGAIAGAWAHTALDSVTRAYLASATLQAASLEIRSRRDGDLYTVAAGGAIATGANTASLAGSVATTDMDLTTEAALRGGTVTLVGDETSGNLTVAADSDPNQVVIAGALSYGGRVGAGAGVAVSDMNATTTATINGTTLAYPGALNVTATADGDVISAAGAVAASKGQLGLAGTLALNTLTNNVEASVRNVTRPADAGAATGEFHVDAANSTNVTTVSGAVGASKNVGLGAAIAYTEINGATQAVIENSTLTTTAAGRVRATSDADILSVAIGVGVGQNVGVAGSATVNKLRTTTKAEVKGTSNLTASSLTVSAADLNSSRVRSLAGAVAGGSKAGVGAAVAINDISNTFQATIDAASITATGSVTVTAGSNAVIESLAVGGAGSQNFALGGSVSINSISNTAEAKITNNAAINAGGVAVSAADQSTARVLAGGIAVSGKAAVGAAVSVNEISNTTRAFTQNSTINVGAGSVTVDALSAATIKAATVAGSGGGNAAVSGSISVNQISNTTQAFLTGGTLTGDTVRVTAYDDVRLEVVAGGLAIGGDAGVGAGQATTITNNLTEAFVGANTTITALGNGSGLLIRTGDANADGTWATTTLRGLGVVAVSGEQVTSIAVGGAGGGKAGVAGSASVIKLAEVTRSHIDAGSLINSNNSSASTLQSVQVIASDFTRTFGVGGALAVGGNAGVGAGVDVQLISKTTEAWVARQAQVNSNGDIVISAQSREDAESLSVAGSAGGTAGIAGAAAVSVLNITTRAYIEGVTTPTDRAVLNAAGSVVVSAAERTEFDQLAGSLAISGSASVGAGLSVPIITKTTEAFLGQNASVNAKGQRAARPVFSGAFDVTYGANQSQEAFPTQNATDGGISNAHIELGGNSSLTGAAPEAGEMFSDPSWQQQRVVTPRMNSVKGVSVTAVNRDDFETIGVSAGGSGGIAVNVGGAIQVANVTTKAHIDAGAQVNQGQTGEANDQDIVVSAGNDFHHFGIAGAAAVSAGGQVAVAPSAEVTVANFTTEAFIADGAAVRAKQDVLVVANAQEDILSLAIGAAVQVSPPTGAPSVALSGSAGIQVLNSTTRAFIGDSAASQAAGATVHAGNNVLVSASDTTDLDAMTGNVAVATGGAGIGLSVGVSKLTKNTQAFIGSNATVNADAAGSTNITVFSGDGSLTEIARGVGVQASSSESITSAVAAGALGVGVGAGGAVGVRIIDSDTLATIKSSAQVNQTTSNTAQSVNVSAVNELTSLTFAGALGGGLAGIGAGVDVGIVRNDTEASIGSNALVSAKNDVDVNAIADRDIRTVAVAGAGGAGALSGSVSVWSIGAPLDANYSYDDSQSGSSFAFSGISQDSLSNLGSGFNPLSRADAIADGNSAGGYGNALDGHAATTIDTNPFVFGPPVTRIDLPSSITATAHGLQTGDAVVYSAGSGGTVVVGLVEGQTYFVIRTDANTLKLATSRSRAMTDNAVNLTFPGEGASHTLTRVVGSGIATAKTRMNDGVGNNVVTAAPTNSQASGTRAVINSGATVSADNDVNVRAINDLNFKVVVGNVTAGGFALGASISVLTIGEQVQALISSTATVRAGSDAGDDILVEATQFENIEGGARAGSAGGVTLGAQVLMVNDHSSQLAKIDSGANINRAGGTVTVLAQADRNIGLDATGVGAAGGVAAGVTLAIATVDGATTATVNGANIGKASGQSVNNLSVTSGANGTVSARVLAVNAALVGAASGAVAITKINPQILATIDTGSQLQLAGNLSVISSTTGSLSSQAIGASVAGGVGLGASVALADDLTQTRASIANSTTITAANAVVNANHSVTTYATATNGAGGLLAGISGAVAKANSAPIITAELQGGSLIATNHVRVLSLGSVNAQATTIGLALGGVAGVGAGVAIATVGGSSTARVSGGTVTATTGNVEVRAEQIGSTEADVAAAAGGILAGLSVNLARAETIPTVRAIVSGTAVVTAGDDAFITALSAGGADAEVAGVVTAKTLAIGVTEVIANGNPNVEAQVGDTARITVGDALEVQALHNFDTGDQELGNNVRAVGSASGGGTLAVVINRIVATANPTVQSHVDASARLSSTSGAISVVSRSRAVANTEASGIVLGALGVGVMNGDAFANGNVKSFLDGTVTGAGSINVLNQLHHEAYALTRASGGGLASVNYSSATAYANPTGETHLGLFGVFDGPRTVTSTGDITLSTVSNTIADSEVVSNTLGLIGVGIVFTEAVTSPTLDTYVSSNTTSTNGNIALVTSHNQDFGYAQSDAAAASGGLAAGVGSDSKAEANARVGTSVKPSTTLSALLGQVSLASLASNEARSNSNGQTFGLVSAGGVLANAVANGSTDAIVDAQQITSSGLIVSARESHFVDAFSSAASGGLVGVSGATSTATALPNTRSWLDSSSTANVTGDVTVSATNSGESHATTFGTTAGGIVVGTSRATVNARPTTEAVLKSFLPLVATGDVTILALNNESSVSGFAGSSGGGAVSVAGATVDITSIPDAKAVIEAGANLTYGATFSANANSTNVVGGEANGRTAGAIGVGSTILNANLGNTAVAATLNAIPGTTTTIQSARKGQLNFVSSAETNGNFTVIGGAGGAIGVGNAAANVNFNNPRAESSLGDFTRISALATDVTLASMLTYAITATTNQVVNGAITGNSTTASVNVTQLANGTADDRAASLARIGNGVQITANSVTALAGLSVDARAFTNASSTAGVGVATSTSVVTANSAARVSIGGIGNSLDPNNGQRTTIVAADAVNLLTEISRAYTQSDAKSVVTGGAGSATSNSNNTRGLGTIGASIETSSGADIRTRNMNVEAIDPADEDDQYIRTATADSNTVVEKVLQVAVDVATKVISFGAGLFGKNEEAKKINKTIREVVTTAKTNFGGNDSVTQNIILNHSATFGAPVAPRVEIAANGNLVDSTLAVVRKADGTVVATGGNVGTGTVSIDPIGNSLGGGSIHIATNSGYVSSDASRWNYVTGFGLVQIVNNSTATVQIGGIDPTSSNGLPPSISVTAPVLVSSQPLGLFATLLAAQVQQNQIPLIDINMIRFQSVTSSVVVTSAGSVLVAGPISNALGAVTVTSTNGSITSTASGRLTGETVVLTASAGTIGSASQRLAVKLSGTQHKLDSASAANGIYLAVSGSGDGSTAASSLTVEDLSVTNGPIDLLLNSAANTTLVQVGESQVTRLSFSGFSVRFQTVTVPVYGFVDAPVATSYQISNVSSSGNKISIAASGDTSLNFNNVTAASGTVTVTGTETARIVDSDSADDITANALLVTMAGGIGSASNRLQVNVAQLEATAGNDGIYVDNRRTQGLTIGGVSADVTGLTSTGTIDVLTSGPLTVNEPITTTGRSETRTNYTRILGVDFPVSFSTVQINPDVTLAASDTLTVNQNITAAGLVTLTTSETPGTDDLIVNAGSTVRSVSNTVRFNAADKLTLSGNVDAGINAELRAFDQIDVQASSRVAAVGSVNLTADDDGTAVNSTAGGVIRLFGGALQGASVSLSGGEDTDQLVILTSIGAAGAGTVWNITANNAGNIASLYPFASFEQLQGGAQVDRFVFGVGSTISGYIDGQGSSADIADYSAYTTNLTINAGSATGAYRNLEGIIGGSGNDNLTGGSGDNILVGGGGNDTISGGGGNDILVGDTADLLFTGGFVSQITSLTEFTTADSITSGAGNSVLIGGGGNDTLSAGSGRNVVIGDHAVVALSAGVVTNVTSTAAVGGNDSISISGGRNVAVGGSGNDTISATSGVNALIGDDATILFNGDYVETFTSQANADGNADSITGGSQDDVIVGGAGNDTLSAGNGANAVLGDYGDATFSQGIIVTLSATSTIQFGNDSITVGSGNDVVIAGKGADTITDNGGTNAIVSDQGSVTLFGRLLATVTSDASTDGGADTVTTGAGSDYIIGGALADSLSSGDGADVVIGDFGTITLNAGVLRQATASTQNDGGADTIQSGNGNDVVIAGTDHDSVVNSGGNDLILGDRGTVDWTATGVLSRAATEALPLAGNDTITGGSGNDTVLGGDGNDNITGGGGTDVIAADLATITFANGSIASLETMTDTIRGNDTVSVSGTSAVVVGGAGADSITATSAGTHVLIGDLATINWSAGQIASVVTTATAFGSGDTVTGSSGNELLVGGSGSDSIVTGDGDNFVLADDGSATFASGVVPLTTPNETSNDGNDSVTAGSGNDQVRMGGGSESVDGGAGNDTLDGGSGDDTLIGGAGNDFLIGGFGNDSMTGGVGNDRLFGGFMVGALTDYDAANDFALPPNFQNTSILFPLSGSYTPPSITPTVFAGLSHDGVVGGDGRDTLDGADGDDILLGGSDDDSLSGALGNDYLDGGAGNETLDGQDGDDVVRGGAGNDVVRGGIGIDQVFGDAGDDQIFGDAGTGTSLVGQRLYGGDGRDTLYAYAVDTLALGEQLFGDADGDFLYGNLGSQLLIGGSGNDFISGDFLSGSAATPYATNSAPATTGGNDTIRGDSGNDQIFGGGGADLILGGAGTDLLEGQAGDNTLFGGSGIDFFTLYTGTGAGIDVVDGHGYNATVNDIADDNATDILNINGTNNDDVILLSQETAAANRVRLDFQTGTGMLRTSYWPVSATGAPTIEQYRIAGLGGNDVIGFVTPQTVLPASITNPTAGTNPVAKALDLSKLSARSRDFVGVFDGNGGNDILIGSAGRDSLNGGVGSDVLYGFAGDDRLWGDQFDGASGDVDVLFGGQGNDDLIGGTGRAVLYAWTFAPQLTPNSLAPTPGASFSAGDLSSFLVNGPSPEFGVFVNRQTGAIQNTDGDLDNNGFLDNGQDLNNDGTVDAPYDREDTGLDRMLGTESNDTLLAGSGLAFMYGNGGQDALVRANGQSFESQDDGLGGNDWKTYARQSDQVWYVGGTNADDEIHVDFVTEPGLLSDHHLVTRLTNNNGNFSFAASVRLDFDATDKNGNPIWDATQTSVNFNAVQAARDAGDTTAVENMLGALPIATINLERDLLPSEGDFQIILIDALGGNDQIEVGPTVQKSVWIDAGAGDDVVRIRGGNTILTDLAENVTSTAGLRGRNDIPTQAFVLTAVDAGTLRAFDGRAANANGLSFTGLTMDSAADVDWYSFTLAANAGSSAKIELASGSPIDGLRLDLYPANNTTEAARLNTASFATTGDRSSISLTGLTAGTKYLLKVTSPNVVPTIYDLRFNLTGTTSAADLAAIPTVSLAAATGTQRSDVLLGGTGDDILEGGGGEDWIFGQAGNDVLSGGLDRQASDLIFGGSGNDTFQIVPDNLPKLGNQPNTNFDPATATYLPTFSDLFAGGDGEDRVMFLGGDTDRRGFDVPDYTALRFNVPLQRYEFTALEWDIGRQEFVTAVNNSGQHAYVQQYQFYQTKDVEQTQFDTRAGDDVVHLDPGFKFAASALTHRYSFSETAGTTLRDSVGTAHATIVDQSGSGTTSGGGGNSLGNGQVRLFGGNKDTADYIELPDTVLSGLSDATFEVWATQQSVQNFARLFDFGGSETDSLAVLFNQTSTNAPGGNHRVDWKDGDTKSLSPTNVFTNTQEIHFVMTVDQAFNNTANTRVTWYMNGALVSSFDTTNTLAQLTADNNWLGRPKGTNQQTADASYNEFRIYNTPLTANQVSANLAAGADRLVVVPTSNTAQFEEWGIQRGDFQQGGRNLAVRVDGGAGNDFLFGGVLNDTLIGGSGTDYLAGNLGNDSLQGDGGADTINGFNPSVGTTTVTAFPANPSRPATFPAAGFAAELYTFDLATPFSVIATVNRAGASLGQGTVTGGVRTITDVASTAFGFTAPDSTTRFTSFTRIGDFNGDGQTDYLASAGTTSYLLLGPVNLSDLSNVAIRADYIIDQTALGRPAESFGDFNGDGKADLAFVDDSANIVAVTTIYGGAMSTTIGTVTTPWPRVWNANFVSQILQPSASNVAPRARLNKTTTTSVGYAVQALDRNGDGTSEYLLTHPDRSSASDPTAQIYNPATNSASEPFLPSDFGLGFNGNVATVVGDLNGDGNDDVIYTQTDRLIVNGGNAATGIASDVYFSLFNSPASSTSPVATFAEALARGGSSVAILQDAHKTVSTVSTVFSPRAVNANFHLLFDSSGFQFTFGIFALSDVTADPVTQKQLFATQALTSARDHAGWVIFDDRTDNGATATADGTKRTIQVPANTEIGFFIVPNNTAL